MSLSPGTQPRSQGNNKTVFTQKAGEMSFKFTDTAVGFQTAAFSPIMPEQIGVCRLLEHIRLLSMDAYVGSLRMLDAVYYG